MVTQNSNQELMQIDSSREPRQQSKPEGIFKKRGEGSKEAHQRNVQFAITNESQHKQSQLASCLDSEEPDPAASYDNNSEHQRHLEIVQNQTLGETRENTFGMASDESNVNKQSFIPLSDPEDEKRLQQERDLRNSELEQDLPGSQYSPKDSSRDQYIQRRLAESST